MGEANLRDIELGRESRGGQRRRQAFGQRDNQKEQNWEQGGKGLCFVGMVTVDVPLGVQVRMIQPTVKQPAGEGGGKMVGKGKLMTATHFQSYSSRAGETRGALYHGPESCHQDRESGEVVGVGADEGMCVWCGSFGAGRQGERSH